MDESIKLDVVSDDNADECLYVNGKRWAHDDETTIYASDLAREAEDKVVRLKYWIIEGVHCDWPSSLEDALAPDGKE